MYEVIVMKLIYMNCNEGMLRVMLNRSMMMRFFYGAERAGESLMLVV